MHSPEVDVLTVTKRTGWEKMALDSLARQTVAYNKYIVISSVPLKIDYIIEPKPLRKYNLNRAYNEGFRHLESEYVLLYDDFIELEPTTIEYLLETSRPNRIVTTATHENGEQDGRYLGLDTPHRCRADEWEINVAMAPTKLFFELGGCDEEYDDRWAWGNVNLAQRAEMIGYETWIDERVKPKLIPHKRDTSRENNYDFNEKRINEIKLGKRPISCDYLVQSKSK